ncbi:hypothetical protein [Mesorhizobium amorphae]|uniref:hypothetical protein n=1 Tax=Mesorhizobium amorphae TaxID=71433 RepID=UPI001785D33A|nr:hypothetical protein [Mesorhizobium amorphae]
MSLINPSALAYPIRVSCWLIRCIAHQYATGNRRWRDNTDFDKKSRLMGRNIRLQLFQLFGGLLIGHTSPHAPA